MWSSPVVSIEPRRQRCRSIGAGCKDPPVGPLAKHRLDEALRLSVRAGPIAAGCVGSASPTPGRQGHELKRRRENRCRSSHAAPKPTGSKEGNGTAQEADCRLAALVGQDLHISEQSDRRSQRGRTPVRPAGQFLPLRLVPACPRRLARLWQFQTLSFPCPSRFSTTSTVESVISSRSAISVEHPQRRRPRSRRLAPRSAMWDRARRRSAASEPVSPLARVRASQR